VKPLADFPVPPHETTRRPDVPGGDSLEEPLARHFRRAGAMNVHHPAASSVSHPVGVPESEGMPGSRQKETRIAPAEAFASAWNMASLSRLNRRRQAASPTPLESKRFSRIASLSMRGRPSEGASRRASVVFPLDGKPETITKCLSSLILSQCYHRVHPRRRRAGIEHARTAEATSTAATTPNATRSMDFTPYSMFGMLRPTSHAPASPIPPGEDPLPPPSGGRGFARPPARSANRSHAYVQKLLDVVEFAVSPQVG